MTDETDWSHVDAVLTERAEAFEQARIARAQELDRQRTRRTTRTTRQFWFLFAVVFASFVLLAYRTEMNQRDLRNGFYGACLARVTQAQHFNEGREALIQAVIHNPDRPVPPEQQGPIVKQLRDGLLLPVEDCGPNPYG